jgi:hypothetical protein
MHGLACERMPSACMGADRPPGTVRLVGSSARSLPPGSFVDGELEDDEDGGRRRRGADLNDTDRQMKVQA